MFVCFMVLCDEDDGSETPWSEERGGFRGELQRNC